jgi:hypothetical protein
MRETIAVRPAGEAQRPSAYDAQRGGPFAIRRPFLHRSRDRLSNYLKINDLNHWHGSCVCPADAPRHVNTVSNR